MVTPLTIARIRLRNLSMAYLDIYVPLDEPRSLTPEPPHTFTEYEIQAARKALHDAALVFKSFQPTEGDPDV